MKKIILIGVSILLVSCGVYEILAEISYQPNRIIIHSSSILDASELNVDDFTLKYPSFSNIQIFDNIIYWDFPEQYNIAEEYLTRYFFPDLGFSFALPKEWSSVYGIYGLIPFDPDDYIEVTYYPYIINRGTTLDMVSSIFDNNPEFFDTTGWPEGGHGWPSNVAISFHRIENIMYELFALAGTRFYENDPIQLNIILAQDDEYTYFATISRRMLDGYVFGNPLSEEYFLSNISQEFLEIVNQYEYILNSFRLIEF